MNIATIEKTIYPAVTKSELARYYDVSRKTLNGWICLMLNMGNYPFSWKDYLRTRVLPPMWHRCIVDHIGEHENCPSYSGLYRISQELEVGI
ncbi:MAG: hypothetical protein MI974_19055 [Chitinophagales bacterium]|nr:hypothetical protein [Chitinophagales bacterium]